MAARSTHVLAKLRSLFTNPNYAEDSINAYIVPMCDAHQSEYIAPCHQRLKFLTGFTGSAGTAVVTFNKAALWTDGRYHLQAHQELDSNWILMREGLPDTPTKAKWLSVACPTGLKIGIDPYLISCSAWKSMSKSLRESGHVLEPIAANLIDEIWDDRPAFPRTPVEPLEIEYTGMTWLDKVTDLRNEMVKQDASTLIISDLAEVAWLLNLRGSDIIYNPVFFSYIVLTMNDIFVFIEEEKFTPAVKKHLQLEHGCITIKPYDQIKNFLSNDLSFLDCTHGRIWLSCTSSYGLLQALPKETKVLSSLSPIQMRKAVKNSTELAGMRKCHIYDGVALSQFFCWLEKNIDTGVESEISVADKLESFRREQPGFVCLSFETISSSGPNSAIIHYGPSKETNRPVCRHEIYLCDSGGQYKNGTTDITRTWHYGNPSQFEKIAYTHVIKGHIALAGTIFPKGVKGNKLDSIARLSLWSEGLDYLHGTGHGVGSYLNVHEGPMGLHYKDMVHDPGLEENMVMTIEPGYYKKEKFGIRLENVYIITKAEIEHDFEGKGALKFEPIAFNPIQTSMLQAELLTAKEIQWINDYHQKVHDNLHPLLVEKGDKESADWIFKNTRPLGRDPIDRH